MSRRKRATSIWSCSILARGSILAGWRFSASDLLLLPEKFLERLLLCLDKFGASRDHLSAVPVEIGALRVERHISVRYLDLLTCINGKDLCIVSSTTSTGTTNLVLGNDAVGAVVDDGVEAWHVTVARRGVATRQMISLSRKRFSMRTRSSPLSFHVSRRSAQADLR